MMRDDTTILKMMKMTMRMTMNDETMNTIQGEREGCNNTRRNTHTVCQIVCEPAAIVEICVSVS